jgi:hypothetical protein
MMMSYYSCNVLKTISFRRSSSSSCRVWKADEAGWRRKKKTRNFFLLFIAFLTLFFRACRLIVKSPRGLNLVNKVMRWCEWCFNLRRFCDNKRRSRLHAHRQITEADCVVKWTTESRTTNDGRRKIKATAAAAAKRFWRRGQWRQQLGIVFTFDSINLTLSTCHQHLSFASCWPVMSFGNRRSRSLDAVNIWCRWSECSRTFRMLQ